MKQVAVSLMIIITGCTMQTPPPDARAVLQADKDFSLLSQRQGMKKAFLTYMDSNAVMLSPKHLPTVGKDLAAHYRESTDTGFILTWEPLYGSVARSGDLGYTYGVYTLKLKNGDTGLHKGTYATIWKQQKDGNWKFVLDTGNEGLEK